MARVRIVIVGSCFAGFQAARTLLRKARGAAEAVLLNPTDYFLYLPLLPEVAGGVLDPRRVTVPLSDTLPAARLVLGQAGGMDVDARTVSYTGPEGEPGTLGYNRLVLAAGSVNKLLPITGVADHAHGFRGFLSVPGHPEILACGDTAAVPDPAHPGQLTPMTAQHALRQGKLAGHNIAASYGVGRRRPYRHRGLGFVVDLGGRQAAANPLQVSLSGLPARVVTRGYHLTALPANRFRTMADWLFTAVGSRPAVQLGLVPGPAVPLDTDAPELVHPSR